MNQPIDKKGILEVLQRVEEATGTTEMEYQLYQRAVKDICAMFRNILNREPSRGIFESIVSLSPFELPVDRVPEDQTKYAFPGQYRDNTTQLAWDIWCDSWKQALINYDDDLPRKS